MELDFDDREQVTDYVSVPPGTYLCRVVDVRERLTRNADALWALRLTVVEGEYAGRDAAWDNLVFSTRGLNRVKRVFTAFGLPNDGKIQVDPGDLAGKEAFVTIRPAEYLSAEGTMIRRNEVPYDGYQSVAENTEMNGDARDHEGVTSSGRGPGSDSGGGEDEDDDPLPF